MKLWRSERSPLITAITPVYNKLDFVQRAVSSLVRYNGLDTEDFQYVLWDQGSPYEGVKEYLDGIREADYPNIKVMGGGVNIGVGACLNRAIENTDSDFIFKFDDDCEMLPLTLPLLIIAYSLALNMGFPLAVLSADVIGTGKAQGEYEEYQLAPGLNLDCCWCVGGGAVLIHRTVLDSVGPFREDRLYGVEDAQFALDSTEKGYKNAYLRGAFHGSFCRTEEADPEIDAWKLDYYFKRTDLPFDEWRSR